jgi:hypothetical protein
MYVCVSNRQKSGKAECCGLAARSKQIDRQRDTDKFVCLPSQGGQSVECVILVTAIKREPSSPTGYLSRRNPPKGGSKI